MTLYEWAAKWGVSVAALHDLKQSWGHDEAPTQTGDGEVGIANAVRVEAAQKGMRMWRNNVGALQDSNGRHVRYGLANDSTTVNKRIKSADLIGIRPIVIGPQHVGHTVGQFVSREVKRPPWHYTGTDREEAQQRWVELVVKLGGDAAFTTGPGSL